MIKNPHGSRAADAVGATTAPPPRPDSELEDKAMKVLEENRLLREHLDQYDAVIRECIGKYRSGVQMQDIVRSMSSADLTIGAATEVMGLFDARRAFRSALVAALVVDGMSLEEVASTFKVSVESICYFANRLDEPLT
jgi:hypothetical protein